jgi:hypothetical protein
MSPLKRKDLMRMHLMAQERTNLAKNTFRVALEPMAAAARDV